MLRYFDLATPLHHEDEERHVFPVLADGNDATLAAALQGLRSDHLRTEEETVFPTARSRIDGAALAHVSADMAQRRGGAAVPDLMPTPGPSPGRTIR